MAEATTVTIRGLEQVNQHIEDIRRMVQNDGSLTPTFRLLGAYLQDQVLDEDFADQGARHGGWKDLSPLTKLLRPNPGRKVKDLDAAKDIPVEIGISTRMMQESFTAGRIGSVFRPDGRSVTVGSNLERARRFDQGGPGTFTWGDEEQERFEANVLKVLPGSIDRTKHPRAVANWNAFYFWFPRSMRKKGAISVNQAARPIAPEPFPFRQIEIDRMVEILNRGMQDVINASAARNSGNGGAL